MASKKIIIGLFVCIVTGFIFAQSQPPTPSPAKVANGEQLQGNKEAQKSDGEDKQATPPLTVENAPTSAPAQGNHQKDANADLNKAANNGWSFLLSVIITIAAAVSAAAAIVQACIYSKQAKLMERGLNVNRAAAEAAEKGAEAAMKSANTSELALKTVERADVQVTAVDGGFQPHGALVVAIHLKNFGRTAANRVKVDFCVGDVSANNTFADTSPKFGMVASGATAKNMGTMEGAHMTHEFMNAVTENREILFLTIIIGFLDVFGTHQGAVVSALYHPSTKEFSVIPIGSM
jgi:hypothetical protein